MKTLRLRPLLVRIYVTGIPYDFAVEPQQILAGELNNLTRCTRAAVSE